MAPSKMAKEICESMALSKFEKEIYKSLKDEGSATIALVGKSGSGKTWIARNLSVLATKDTFFGSIIWLFLNKKYNKVSLYKSIANQLSLFSDPWKTLELWNDEDDMDIVDLKEEKDEGKLEEMISDALKGKKILIVLDDEGKEMKMEEIDVMLPSSLRTDCKVQVLITTLNEEVSNNNLDPKVIKMRSLSKEESMSLLIRRAGSKSFEFPDVKVLAETFVTKVMDQPAAIIVAAKALSYFCKSNSGVKIIESALKEVLNDEKPNPMKLLFNAHEMLPSRILVDCAWLGPHFFRDRGSVQYNELIAYWILEGYLGHINSIKEAYEQGHRVLMDLIDCQLLKKVDGDSVILEKSAEADYIVRKRTMLGLDKCHRSGFDGITNLGLAGLFVNGKWGGLGRVTHADGMIRTPQKKQTPQEKATPQEKKTPQKRQEISMAMLDGNGMCQAVLNKFCQSNPQLQVLAIFNPTLESLSQAFNPLLPSHPSSISNPIPTSQPPIVSSMTELDILVLRGCDFLVDIGYIRELSKLTVLEISGASSLFEIPSDVFDKMTKLQSLHLSSLQIKNMPSSFYKLTKLQRLLLKDCSNLDKLERLAECDSLVVLNLSGATSLKEFPYRNLEPMQKLRTLDLSNTGISNLIRIGRIEQLTSISLRDCPNVNRIPSIASLPHLQVLDISGAKKIVEIHDISFEKNLSLDILDFSETQITKLPSSIGNPRHVYLKGCSSLENLPFMVSLENLESLDLSDASNVEIDENFFEFLGKLRLLNLSNTNIKRLPKLSKHPELRHLLLSRCSSLCELPQLEHLTKLEVLDLSGCTVLTEIQAESFDQMTCLQKIVLSNTPIENLPSLSELSSLRVLLLRSCTKLKALPSLESLSKLEELNLSSVTCLGETCADFLENKGHLQILDLSETNIKNLSSVSKLENLCQLFLRGCMHLEEASELEHLTKLEVLDLSGTAISQLPSLENHTNLHQLLLKDCPNLDLFLHADNKKINHSEEERVKPYQWHISNVPDMITDCNRPFTSVSGSTFLKLLEENPLRQLLQKSPLLQETGFKQFHLSVRPMDKQTSGGIHCYKDVRGIYFQARRFPDFDEQGISLEICGFHDFPEGIDVVMSQAAYVFLFDNIFIKDLYGLGGENIKLMKGCWIERCERMQSVFPEGDSKLGEYLEVLWLSNVPNLTGIYSGNLQQESFQNLKKMYLDCCPGLSSVFSSSQLPEKLEILQIKFCDNLETVVENSKSGHCKLPNLQELKLISLPKLKSIGAALPACNRIVRDCPQLPR